MPGDLIVFLVTRVLGKNADKKLGRERRHVSGEGEVMSMFAWLPLESGL